MSSQLPGPVVCFSYLAAAELWTVPRFPLANAGAEVLSIEASIAADGPMVAAVLAALDVPALLLANDIGNDLKAIEAQGWLQRHDVATTAEAVTGAATPQIVVVADDVGTRTWFPYLPGVVDGLGVLDLSSMTDAAFAYIDCYQLIEGPAVRTIDAARTADVPMLVNLGGSPLSPAVIAALRGHPRLIVQTNIDDAAQADAPRLAASIRAATNADWAVVTAGAHGAVAVGRTEQLNAQAFRVSVRHTHCAGAAFSGGLLYGLLHDWPMSESLILASATGALRCERAHYEPLPTLTELKAFISSRERIAIPAA
jgi:sugar/nucleoside kinase (ribokinase family)